MKTRSIFLIAAVLLVAVLAFTSCDLISQYLPGDKHEHTWQDATCTSPRTCTSCNATEGEPLGHTEEVVAGKEASCSEKGLTEGKKCSLCGEILVAQQEIPIKDHTEETVPGSDASCTETGLTEGKRCADCGITLVEQQEIPLKDHTEEIIPGKDATCTDNGLTEGKKCSVCGETLVPREEIPPVAHTEEVVPGRAPTCTETGLTDGKKCSVCGTTLLAQEEIPIEHKEETVAGKAPTCTETGLTEGKKCSLCGAILLKQEEISSLGHKDEDGDYECDVCHAELCTNHIPAEPIVENKKDSSCSETGSYDSVIKCSVCGDELERETKTIEKLPHTEEEIAGKAATCTETGLTAGKKCSVCGEILEAQQEIGKLPHTEEEIAGKDATCSETGLTAGKKCSVCGEILEAQQEIGKLPHTEQTLSVKAPSCVATGLTEGKKCSVCGEILTEQETIPAEGHKWNGGETLLDVTTYECEVCGVQKVESAKLENEDNIFSGKEFVPTPEADAVVLKASWFAGGGYEVLTDGTRDQEQVGRFSTLMNNTTSFMEATLDLQEKYVLGKVRFYIYDTKDSLTEAYKKASIGSDILIQVYLGDKWYDVVVCANNEELCGNLVINEGVNNDYIEFDLTGIVAEKVRFLIDSAASKDGITYQEIECGGALLNEHVHTETILPAEEATCLQAGKTEGVVCNVCNTTLKEQQVIDALGHSWGEPIVADGKTVTSCTVCGLTKLESADLESVDNLFAGKRFNPTDAALASALSASWWKGSGYPGLTDGIKNADNAPGRFATKMALDGMMDATIDLGGEAVLGTLRFYTYDPSTTNPGTLGADLLIQVYRAEKWIDVVVCKNNASILSYLVASEGAYNDYLEFDLTGISAEKIRFYISASASTSGTSYEEIECSGRVFPTDEPVFVENVFTGKQFVPTDAALASVLAASWWKGSGYPGLTDGIRNADNAAGRFSTVMALTGMMDATIDLGGSYELHSLKFYTYDPAAGTNAGSLGADLLIQVYTGGEWVDVVTCADNASIAAYLVVNEGTYNDYLEFDLEGIEAEKVRFYISASAVTSGTSYEEIECTAYTK